MTGGQPEAQGYVEVGHRLGSSFKTLRRKQLSVTVMGKGGGQLPKPVSVLRRGPAGLTSLTCAAVNTRFASEPASVPSTAAPSTWSYVDACTRWYVVQRRTDAGEAEMKNNAT